MWGIFYMSCPWNRLLIVLVLLLLAEQCMSFLPGTLKKLRNDASKPPCDLLPISSGALFQARRAALEYSRVSTNSEKRECASTWRNMIDEKNSEPDFLHKVNASHWAMPSPLREVKYVKECWSTGKTWSDCCAGERGDSGNPLCFDEEHTYEACCTFGVGSTSVGSIPALQEHSPNPNPCVPNSNRKHICIPTPRFLRGALAKTLTPILTLQETSVMVHLLNDRGISDPTPIT